MKIDRFTGINNRQPIHSIKNTDAGMPVRDAVNVDLSASGTLKSRSGYSVVISNGARSAFSVDSTGALVAIGSELMRFDGTAATKIDDLSSEFARVAYVKTPIGVVWSDGFVIKLVRDWVSGPLAAPMPNPGPSVSVLSGGSLVAGEYGVSFCAVLPDGRRSPMSYPVSAFVADGGIIRIQTPTQQYPVDVFMTTVDGSVFYKQGRITSGALDVAIHSPSSEGLLYQVEAELPPGRILSYRSGRMFSAVGNMLYYTQPWSLVFRPMSDFIPFVDDIRLIASVDAGLFVATETKTWFIAGEPQEGTMREVMPFGAVKGTLVETPNSTDLIWFTPRGQVRVSQDGRFELLQDREIMFPTAETGASIFREYDGARQVISTLSAPTPSGSAVARSFLEFIES